MPSPVGHALGGLAAGWLVGGLTLPGAGRPVRDGAGRSLHEAASVMTRLWVPAMVYAALGALPDADFLVRAHSAYSHSIGAVLLVGAVAAAAAPSGRLRFALACSAAYGTHVLFDWLGSDTSPPIGIMALWPFTDRFYQSSLHVFDAISRRYWLPGFWAHNVGAVARELLLLGPVVAFVLWWRLRIVVVTPGRARRPQYL